METCPSGQLLDISWRDQRATGVGGAACLFEVDATLVSDEEKREQVRLVAERWLSLPVPVPTCWCPACSSRAGWPR